MPRDHRFDALATLDGWLDRPVSSGDWHAPSDLRLDGDELRWRGEPFDGTVSPTQGCRVVPGAGMLEGFLSLDGAPAEAFLDYAAVWGVMRLCSSHGLPASHAVAAPFRVNRGEPSEDDPCRPAAVSFEGEYAEPIGGWRRICAEFRSVLSIAVALHDPRDKRDLTDDWVRLSSVLPFGDGLVDYVYGDDGRNPRERHTWLLALAIQRMLDWGATMVDFRWDGDAPTLEFGTQGLYGALAVQLALTVARRDGFVICDECGRPYIPNRRPRAGVAHRCQRIECKRKGKAASEKRRRDARASALG